MLEGALAGTGMEVKSCRHEFDKTALPKWHKRLGKVFTCTKCGAELVRPPQPVQRASRIRVSKKDRRRLKMVDEAVSEEYGSRYDTNC